jgi:hypothetical protein
MSISTITSHNFASAEKMNCGTGEVLWFSVQCARNAGPNDLRGEKACKKSVKCSVCQCERTSPVIRIPNGESICKRAESFLKEIIEVRSKKKEISEGLEITR